MQQSGRLGEAAKVYRGIIAADPLNFKAIHYLGMAEYQRGEKTPGLAFVNQSIVLAPYEPTFFSNRGSIYEAFDNIDAARQDFERASKLQPTFSVIQESRARLLLRSREYALAVTAFKASIASNPGSSRGWLGLSTALRAQVGSLQIALDAANKSLLLDRLSPDAWSHLGNLNHSLENYVAARENFTRLTVLMPDKTEWQFKLAAVEISRHRYSWAITTLNRVVRIDSNHLRAVILLARALETEGNLTEALHWMFHARALDPSSADTDVSVATVLFRTNRFSEGWRFYRSRWRSEHLETNGVLTPMLRTTRPEFSGASRSGRVLVWAEQGVGDEIMFGTLLEEFNQICGQMVLQVDRRLVALFMRAFPGARVFERGQPVPEEYYDHHLPMGDLGKWLRPTVDSFVGKNGRYLKSVDGFAAQVRRDLGVAQSEKLIGLSWRSIAPGSGKFRSLSLNEVVEVFRDLHGVKFMALQYDDVDGEIEAVRQETGAVILRCRDVDYFEDIERVASLVECCDLVVSVGNTIAHLAGALGKRTWVLLPPAQGWRWLEKSGRCVWYDSVRCFRGAVNGSNQSLRSLLPLNEL
jgi:tetratricopeptide (TPR) repeat protein